MSDAPTSQVRHNPPPKFRLHSASDYGLELLEFSKKYQWIYNRPLVAFLEEDLASKLPAGWVDALSASDVPLNDLVGAIGTFPGYKAWPSSLKQFLEGCRDLSMPRTPSEIPLEQVGAPAASELPLIVELDPNLCVGMKSKKIHEVKMLSNMVHELCGGIPSVVDVGSGKGYIAQALSHHFGYQVIGLEGSENQHEKAAQRFEKTEQRRLPKKDRTATAASASSSDTSEPALLHSTVNCRLEYSMECTDLDTLVAARLRDKSSNICLMSLHACGDLSPCILELFTKWDRAKVLINVACCYHKIEASSMERKKGFPMSALVRSSDALDPPHFLWLELATQSPLQWQAMTPDQVELRLNKLFFRCLLEILFRQTVGSEASTFVMHIQKMKSDSVYQSLGVYLPAALGRSKIKPITDSTLSTAQVEQRWSSAHEKLIESSCDLEKQYEPQKKAMKVWLALQSCFASVAESLVILDRWLYLVEECERMALVESGDVGDCESKAMVTPTQNDDAKSQSSSPTSGVHTSPIIPWIIPVFDQAESPRNLALVAIKLPCKP